jgi:tryptophan halogenase
MYSDEVPIEDFALSYFPASALYENNKFSENRYGQFDNFNPKTDVAFHFDATKFGQWLKNNYSIPRGVKHVSATVVDVVVNEQGVDYLVLDNGEKITSDLFVDATGWKSLLLGEALKVPFESYSNLLPNNKAWATRIPYINKEQELEPFTNCTALGNGWAWNIPLWSRIGTGYVFSDKFVSEADALDEFKNYLCSDKMLIPRKRELVDALEYKLIDMRIGVHEKIWEKNVVAIGLSAGFIEPLESNGLYTVHEYLFALLKAMSREVVTQIDKDFFNYACSNLYSGFAEFVAQHYKLSIRDDTEYWRTVTEKTIYEHLKISEHKTSSSFNAQYSYKYTTLSPDIMAGINYISVGMHHIMTDRVDMHRAIHYRSSIPLAELENIYFPRLTANKHRWAMAAVFELTLYEYLNEKYYQEHKGNIDNG